MNFKVFLLVAPEATSRPVDHTQLLASIVDRSTGLHWYHDDTKLRYGLAKCTEVETGVVFGTIVQQYRVEQHLYDDMKVESTTEVDSYEDRYFMMDMNSMKLSLEWRQFKNRHPLNQNLFTSRAKQLLTCRNLEEDEPYGLEKVSQITEKGRFIDLFYESRRVLLVEVRNFGKYEVPADVVLVNDINQLEGGLREIMHHDTEIATIDKFRVEAPDDGQTSLKRAALARAGLHSGDPEEIRFQDADGNVLIRRRKEEGRISLEFEICGDEESSRKKCTELLRSMRQIDIDARLATKKVGTKSKPTKDDKQTLELDFEHDRNED